MTKPSFKEFTILAMLEDQTEIVQFIFQNERKIDPQECFYNKHDITVNLSSGKITMPSQKYHDIIDRYGAEFRSLMFKMEELEDANEDISGVEAEMEKLYTTLLEYDETVYEERTIYEWRLIPLWIAEILIKQGETVFRHMGNNWWGVKEILQTGILNHKMLTEIYEGID